MIEYRREVDGLRAVAVFPVLLFHAGFDAFSGGYVGVDVFFVISGYLITSIILSDMGGEGFSITRFYERRARRILPALVFVVLCTLPFSYFYMLPEQTVNFGQSVVSVALFFSNFQFWAEAGYFGASAEEMPLLHSWSLSVEEQFYLVFPLVLLVVNRYAKQYLFPLVLLALVVSLAVTEYALGFAASAAYFWSPFRAWELLIGVLLALHMTKAGRPSEGVLTELGGLLGLAMIGYSVVAFDSETPFPGVWALLPTLGTGLVLYCASGNNWAGRVLSIGPVVG
ncbi:MAG: acyltransferase family protein, partial [Alphaproteobacteria bacterium]